MKEFSIEAFKNGAPVVTRDGLKVRILCTDCPTPPYCIVGYIDYGYRVQVGQWTGKGEYYSAKTNSKDLVLNTQKRTAWINIHKTPKGVRYPTRLYKTAEDALRSVTSNTIDTIEIEWEDVEYEGE